MTDEAEKQKPIDETQKPVQSKAEPEKPAAGGKPQKEVKTGGRRKNRPDNCVQCNKRLSKKQWYYRNNRFYCSKTCWKAATVKQTA